MAINGIYKIGIEMTARKQVQGLTETAKRLLGHGGADLPVPPDIEDHIRSVFEHFKASQNVFDSFEMTITDATSTVRTSEGEMIYEIKSKKEIDKNHVVLELQSDEMGTLMWNVTHSDKAFLIDSVDGLSEYAFERK